MDTHVTEIIPKFNDMPPWMKEAFKSGQFFAKCRDKVAVLEQRIEELEKELIKKRGRWW